MIYKTLLFVTTISALFLSGCSQKVADLEGASVGKNNVSDATQIAKETVSIDENAYGNENNTKNNNNANGTNGKNTVNTSKYNSSSDGLQSIYFGFGNYGISGTMENHMHTNTSVIAKAGTGKIKVEGNCDEFGTDEYNYALGLKRAKAVKDNLVEQGVSSNKIAIITYGESNPVCSAPTDSCYAQNRRVDLRIVN